MNLDRKIPKEAKDKFLVELSHNIFFFSSTWRIFSHFPRISGVQNFTWNCKLTCKRMFFSIVFLGQAPNISTIGIAVCVIFNSLFICVTQRLLGWVVYGFFIRSTWWGGTEKIKEKCWQQEISRNFRDFFRNFGANLYLFCLLSTDRN